MTACDGRLNALVIFAFPGAQGATLVHACWSSGPARWWIALSTPDPRFRLSFAALTTTSMEMLVMSSWHSAILLKAQVDPWESLPHGAKAFQSMGLKIAVCAEYTSESMVMSVAGWGTVSRTHSPFL